VKKSVENKTFKMVAHHLMRSLHRISHDVRRRYRQLHGSSKIKKLRWWILFLLDSHPNPTHRVIESDQLIIALCCALPYMVIADTTLALYCFYFGMFWLPALMLLIGMTALVGFETLHIIFDRPKH
jgi:hypothetical protein